MRSRGKWLIFVVLLGGVVLFYPFEKALVPSKRVLVVTEDMRPIKDAFVRQIWQDYSLERYGHEEDLATNAQGRITFPRRTIRASLFRRVVGPVTNVVSQGVHASFDIHTDMFPLPKGGRVASNETIQPHSDEIVYRVRLN